MQENRIGYTLHDRMPTKRILLVDDDELIREMMGGTLKSLGYRFVSEGSGVDALKTFKRHPDHFDLILTDLLMVDMTGDRLSEQVKSIRRDIPVVLITGSPDQITRERVRVAGICEVLEKPVSRIVLSRTLRRFCN
ncbi:MAG: Sensor histidine kinase RcsC [Syntrophorhabdaceae bacterium PtaU1.Bin034]|nr:MAG: Sensor histidine kinase RcsC [Syntrophorhabdaceae bacterium PtaU1.Bin034]